MKQLGMRLRALREGIGLSQSKFADVIPQQPCDTADGQAQPQRNLYRLQGGRAG